ncbi:hypothetical protein [Chitinimonas koreensis]|uniref:hypothetical protein n=1 Tax=Chitinimonas koreensis TaxID=356302 RepID=UPI0012FAD886|nr:hypothetical protein [Chitinimonas koreensis]QNM96739.1 hypothetical protein H9L41_23840 [Chitinimonas koreensis]
MPRTPRAVAVSSPTPQSRKAPTLRQTVRRLNEHHTRTLAGFYGDEHLPGRWFRARLVDGTTVEVHDWINWVPVPDGTTFRDHNGRHVLTVRYPVKNVLAR